MNFHGHLNFNENQAQQMALEVVSEFPQTPVMGQVVFKSKRVWICVSVSGTPLWVPLGQPHNTYVHTQSTGSTAWEIQHDFNTTTTSGTPIYPLVQVYGADGSQIIPQALYYVDDSTVMVDLGYASTGKAVCMYGDTNYYEGLITPQYAYIHDQIAASDTWVVRHWLGYTPVVRAFDSEGVELTPTSVTVDDIFQVTIRFDTSVSGSAKLI